MNGCSSSSNSGISSYVVRTLRLKNPKLLLLETCSNISHLKVIHAYMIRTHIITDLFAASRLIAFCTNPTYGTSFLDYAQRIFSQIQNPNLFIYNAMVRVYSGSKNPQQSFQFYRKLQQEGLLPDNLTFPYLVKSCAEFGCVGMGIQALGQIIKHGFESDVYVQNSLVHMYATCGDIGTANRIFRGIYHLDVVSWTSMIAGYNKCGDVESARRLFDKMPERNLVTWSIMINGYVRNHHFNKAIELFQVLQSEGVQANETVMVSVIAACAHLGALEQGEKAHNYVLRHKLNVNLILGTALVDMYARCGI